MLPQGPDNAVVTVTILPGGDVLVGGAFANAGGASANNVARWDGTTWSAIGPGLGAGSPHQVITLTTLPNGDAMAGGAFDIVPGALGENLARLSTSCPATATGYGAGCTGSGGLNTLTVGGLPWIGSVMRSTTTGVQPGSIALAIWGWTQISIPLSSVLPIGQPGCNLLASPDFLIVTTAAGNSVASQLAVPNSPSLIGGIINHQVALVEVGAPGAFTKFTSSNAVAFTIGDS